MATKEYIHEKNLTKVVEDETAVLTRGEEQPFTSLTVLQLLEDIMSVLWSQECHSRDLRGIKLSTRGLELTKSVLCLPNLYNILHLSLNDHLFFSGQIAGTFMSGLCFLSFAYK